MLLLVELAIEYLRPFGELLLPLIFIGSFVLAGIAIYWSDRDRVRQTFIAGFLITLLVFQTVMPLYVTPFINWHKFSEPAPMELTSHDIVIVDAAGQEISWDRKATFAFNGVQSGLGTRMVEMYDEETNNEIAVWLLEQSCIYREQVEQDVPQRGSTPADVFERPERLYRFPAHSVSAWSPGDVEPLGTFVGIQVYEVTTTTSSDGTTVVAESRELVAEYYPEDDRLDVC